MSQIDDAFLIDMQRRTKTIMVAAKEKYMHVQRTEAILGIKKLALLMKFIPKH